MKIRNISWTLGGLLAPIIVALISFPIIINNVGIERFGLLSLAWGLIGYAGIFDLGIGRATTQLVSKYIGLGDDLKAHFTLKMARKMSLTVGGIGAVILLILIFFGGWKIINVSKGLEKEVLFSFIIISFTIPFQCLSTMYRGYCEAYEKFKEISIARMFLGIMNFAGPCGISYFSSSVPLMVFTLFFSRVIAVIMFGYMSKRLGTSKKYSLSDVNTNRQHIRTELLSFGGWYTISSVISPFLVQVDKLFIGTFVSATAVGLYTIPYEVVTKTIIFATALSTVAFPRYAGLWIKNRKLAFREFNKWLGVLTLCMGGGCSILAIILPDLLFWWIGEVVTDDSLLVGRLLCVGIFFNAIGIMYYTLIHASGDSKSTAFIHMFELPVYLFILFTLILKYGVVGAALAWTLRMIIDSCLMAIVASKKKNE